MIDSAVLLGNSLEQYKPHNVWRLLTQCADPGIRFSKSRWEQELSVKKSWENCFSRESILCPCAHCTLHFISIPKTRHFGAKVADYGCAGDVLVARCFQGRRTRANSFTTWKKAGDCWKKIASRWISSSWPFFQCGPFGFDRMSTPSQSKPYHWIDPDIGHPQTFALNGQSLPNAPHMDFTWFSLILNDLNAVRCAWPWDGRDHGCRLATPRHPVEAGLGTNKVRALR